MKLTIGLKNFKGVLVAQGHVAMTSSRLSFASVELDKKIFVGSTLVEMFMSLVVTLPAATRVFLPLTREAEEREPWNEIVLFCAAISHPSGSLKESEVYHSGLEMFLCGL